MLSLASLALAAPSRAGGWVPSLSTLRLEANEEISWYSHLLVTTTQTT